MILRETWFHIIATRPGGRTKTIANKTDADVLTKYVIPFVSDGTIKEKWGKRTQTYQALELRIFGTRDKWNKKTDGPLEKFVAGKKNRFPTFESRANASLTTTQHRVFIIMPIQGEKFGDQDAQRIYREYDARFETLERALSSQDCVAIRIDKEYPMDELVRRIKDEIQRSQFVVADLTDERPSCYFEAGFAEASGKKVIYTASKQSVINPKQATKIHFDIHQNVQFFTNQKELREKVLQVIKKNKATLLAAPKDTADI